MSFRKIRVVATDAASADISDILIHTEMQWDRAQRDIYWRLIEETVERLISMPSIGRIEKSPLSFDVRSVLVGTHRLYYWVDGDQLVIARLLHNRQESTRIDWRSLSVEPENPT